MSEANLCPLCGAVVPEKPDPPEAIAPDADHAPTPVLLYASGSHDEELDGNAIAPGLPEAEPDPILGAFVAPSSTEMPLTGESSGFDPVARPSSPSFPAFTIDPSPAPAPVAKAPVDDDPEGEDWPPERPRSMGTVLLASYASAITLGLAWTLYQKSREPEATPATPIEARPIVGHQAELSRLVKEPEPILAEHRATLKTPLTIGSLEVTPLEIRREPVKLQRTGLTGQAERRDGGKDALALRLRLRNVSKDAVFAPLDQAYVRPGGDEVSDSYLETADGERVYPYPLATESEWSIVGQDFAVLRPGEARVVSIVSAPETTVDPAGPLTWRVRLRTGIDRTDIVGVQSPAKPAK